MKKNRIAFLLIALSMLSLQSCLKDDEKVYDESGDRVEKNLINAKSVLSSAENGWALAYFPHRQLKYGGYNYCLKFTEDNMVTVWYEEAPGQSATSTYAMTSDDGPVLSFDTYNKFMHIYATPSQGEYEAKDGDFEFILLKVTDEQITLKGKRSGNIMYMDRLSVTPEEHLKSIQDMKDIDHLYGGGTVEIAGVPYDATFDMRNRRLTITDSLGKSVASRTYIFTKTGIQLADTIEVGGVIMQDFTFNTDDNSFSSAGTVFKMESTYRKYKDFLGTYKINELTAKTVTIKQKVADSTYVVDGLTYQGSPIMRYDAYWGSVEFTPQYMDHYVSGGGLDIYDWLVLTDGDMIYYGEEYVSTAAVFPGNQLRFTLGSNGMTIMEYAFSKPGLEDEGNEALGLIEEYPQTMVFVKQ